MKIARPQPFIATLLAFALLFRPTAYAADDASPIGEYQAFTSTRLYLCKLGFQLHQMQVSNGDQPSEQANYGKCVVDAKAASKAPFATAMKTIKKASAREALKSVQVAFFSALDGIHPGSDEIRLSYQQRQQRLKEDVDRAWSRFEVEE